MREWTRRAVLGGGMVGAGALLLGGKTFAKELEGEPSAPDYGPAAVDGPCSPTSPVRYSEINGWPTYYSGNFASQDRRGAVQAFTYDRVFYAHLERWAQFWYRYNPWPGPTFLVSNGTLNSANRCGSWHRSARAIDIARIYTRTASGTYSQVCDANWHEWHDDAAAGWYAKLYWATVASLSYHFSLVLTFAYEDTQADTHQNHLHIDVSENGFANGAYGLASWNGRRSQTVNLQHMLYSCWGYTQVRGTGTLNDATTNAAYAVMSRAGRPGRLPWSSSNDYCHFLHATWQHANGSHPYR